MSGLSHKYYDSLTDSSTVIATLLACSMPSGCDCFMSGGTLSKIEKNPQQKAMDRLLYYGIPLSIHCHILTYTYTRPTIPNPTRLKERASVSDRFSKYILPGLVC